MSPAVEAVVCLRDQDIDDDDGGVGRVRGVHGPRKMSKASIEDKEMTKRPRDWRKRQRQQRFVDNNGGCGVAMAGLKNWQPQGRRLQRKISLRTQQ